MVEVLGYQKENKEGNEKKITNQETEEKDVISVNEVKLLNMRRKKEYKTKFESTTTTTTSANLQNESN